MANKYLVVLVVGLCSVSAYWDDDLPPGPYCVTENMAPECCNNRQDGCSRKILDTLCYCDQFCDRPNGRDDCCPDYVPQCRGAPQPIIHVASCSHDGRVYFRGEQTQQDCNSCTCLFDEYANRTRWECSQDQCIISSEVLEGVRREGRWRAKSYDQFQGKKLKEGLIYKLGTLPLSPATERMGPIRYDKDIDYPVEFDSRTFWRGYISPVINQGWCGSDWAVTLAGVASDRFAIQSNGAESMLLSPQILLSCNVKQQQGCAGGHIDVAWNFAKNFGLVDEICFPYNATRTPCPFKKISSLREDGCRPSVKQRVSRYQVGPVGRLLYQNDIMYDIMSSGPVFAVMTVHQDFFHYGSGIYRRSAYGNNQQKGLHSVRIVGWGQENGDKYWIVANSWGTEWGEDGYFRIARGNNESGIESFVVSATAEVEAYQRK